MRSSIRFNVVMFVSVSVLSTFYLPAAGMCFEGDEPSSTSEFSGPSQKEYREEYDRDAVNQKKQSWEQYWGWVKSFHEGTFFVSGWTDRAKRLVDGIKPGPERKKLVKDITAFGNDLCKEWAKDSSVCKIGTADLKRWGQMVDKAKKTDAGDGEALAQVILDIRKEYQKKVSPTGP